MSTKLKEQVERLLALADKAKADAGAFAGYTESAHAMWSAAPPLLKVLLALLAEREWVLPTQALSEATDAAIAEAEAAL
jgi:hypothetical protein